VYETTALGADRMIGRRHFSHSDRACMDFCLMIYDVDDRGKALVRGA
jgi:hypothetical protein